MKTFVTLLFTCIVFSSALTIEAFGQAKSRSNKFEVFVPPAYRIMDMASADLNYDNYPDYVLVLQHMNETWDGDELRPLLIIIGGAKGSLNLLARNDSIVLNRNAGGVFGDPYKSISLKNGLLSIEHSIGSSWKWNRIISFTYDSSIKDFVLYKDADISYHISDPNKQTDVLYNKEDYNQLVFAKYSFNKNSK
ncbi:MAG TPA: hypothetical protein VF622_18165 [Segetibacter sp.]|jgi:hypothetical protein